MNGGKWTSGDDPVGEADAKSRARTPEQAELATEVCAGLKAYFDRALRPVLLYKQARKQHTHAVNYLTAPTNHVTSFIERVIMNKHVDDCLPRVKLRFYERANE